MNTAPTRHLTQIVHPLSLKERFCANRLKKNFLSNDPTLALTHLIFIGILAVFLCFDNLNTGAKFGPGTGIDESWYIETAQELSVTHKWWLPTREGKRFLYKPPLKLWVMAASSAIFGPTLASFRLVDALLGLMTIYSGYLISAYLFRSLNAGLFAALALMGTDNFFFANGVRYATLDTLMLSLSGGALLLLAYVCAETELAFTPKAQRLWGALIGLMVGLAVLTKSVQGYYIFGVFGVWIISARLLRRCWNDLRPLIISMVVIAILIPACWFVPHILFTRGAWALMFSSELVARFSTRSNHPDEPLFYLKIFYDGHGLPLIPLLLGVGFSCLQLLPSRFNSVGMEAGLSGPSLTTMRRRYLFLLIWALLPLVVFSALPSRLEWYINACFLPMSCLIGAIGGYSFDQSVRSLTLLGARRITIPRHIITALAWLGLTSLVLIPISFHIAKDLNKVSQGLPRLDIDEVVQEILRITPDQADVKNIFWWNAPGLATREKIFYNMVSAQIQHISSLEEFALVSSAKRPYFILTSVPEISAVKAREPCSQYRILKPVIFDQGPLGLVRRENLAVLAYLPEEINSSELIHFRRCK